MNGWMDVMDGFLSLPVGRVFRDLEVRWVILVFGILV